jgi:hypothetical protein
VLKDTCLGPPGQFPIKYSTPTYYNKPRNAVEHSRVLRYFPFVSIVNRVETINPENYKNTTINRFASGDKETKQAENYSLEFIAVTTPTLIRIPFPDQQAD